MTYEPTRIPYGLSRGNPALAPQLIEGVYDDLRRLARNYLSQQSCGQSIQPTVVVHEAYLKMVKQDESVCQSRSHFFAVGATAMRQIICDHARRRHAARRGGGEARRVSFDGIEVMAQEAPEQLLSIDEALTRLAEQDERKARIVELRFFAGLNHSQIAELVGIPFSPQLLAAEKSFSGTGTGHGNSALGKALHTDSLVRYREVLTREDFDAICEATPEGIVSAIRYGIDLVGVDHAALGSDFDGSVAAPLDTSELSSLTHQMLSQGFSEEEIRAVMGENTMRFLAKNLPAQ